ncbi:TraB/VirB10 family protein [Pseudoalteromonas rubra]|uniref:Conjugal transfer protein TraB n=1 Tax=Pseudoalteromonas rubra TaxID=43658 RepID=A0A0U3GMM7_9GAMM|nr:TraB/VirB10 family protein [Pseudoalteromonas rubra]ALU46154.1 hypothetical protein AT705_24640 [Pseudoalteromonas rubra]
MINSKQLNENITNFLEAHPKARVGLMVGVGSLAVLFLATSLFSDEQVVIEQQAQSNVQSILGMSDSLDNLDKNQAADMIKEMTVRMQEKERTLEAQRMHDSEQVTQLLLQLEKLNSRIFELEKKAPVHPAQNGMYNDVSANIPQRVTEDQTQGQQAYRNHAGHAPNVMYRSQTQIVTQNPHIEGNVIRTITQRSVREVQTLGEVTISDIKVNRLTEHNTTQAGSEAADPERSADRNPSAAGDDGEFTLTMGSIISGTIINGVAAPTKVGSQDQPIPIFMRVKREALMPNFFSLDIRECMMLGAAMGDLASERVKIRAEAISCITADGQAIEKRINAVAVSSSDGLEGIRGTVVERSGKAIMNSVKAGFLSGFASAAKPQSLNAIVTEPEATTAWQSQNLNKFAGAGMMNGASNAMERVASYYLAIAESMWPVIEIPAGIEVDFIVQQGMTLQLNDSLEE